MAGDITTYVVAGIRYDSVVKTVITTVQRQKFDPDTGKPRMIDNKVRHTEIDGTIFEDQPDLLDAIERYFYHNAKLQVFYSNSKSKDAERVIGIEIARGNDDSEYFQEVDYATQLKEVEVKFHQLFGKILPVGIFVVVSVDA